MLTETDKIAIGQLVAECTSLKERKRVRTELTELFNCTHQTVSAASIWYNIKHHIPHDQDIDEWTEALSEYSNDQKVEYRQKIKTFISRAYNPRDFKDLKLICLPSIHCWEIEDYLDLGILPQNIWGIESDNRTHELMQYKATTYGINTVCCKVDEFSAKYPNIVIDIAVLDYKGSLNNGRIHDIKSLNLIDDATFIANYWCRRELTETQSMLDAMDKVIRAYNITTDVYSKNATADPNKIAKDLNSRELTDSRNAIIHIINNQLLNKFGDRHQYADEYEKMTDAIALGKFNNLFTYMTKHMIFDMTVRDHHTYLNLPYFDICMQSYYDTNDTSGQYSFRYKPNSKSEFNTIMIKMEGRVYDKIFRTLGEMFRAVALDNVKIETHDNSLYFTTDTEIIHIFHLAKMQQSMYMVANYLSNRLSTRLAFGDLNNNTSDYAPDCDRGQADKYMTSIASGNMARHRCRKIRRKQLAKLKRKKI